MARGTSNGRGKGSGRTKAGKGGGTSTPTGTVKDKPNTVTRELVAPFLSRIENLFAEMLSEQGSYMAFCKGKRDEIKDIYVEAKNAGIQKKALATFVEERKLLERLRKNRAALEGDVQETFEQIVGALGEFGDLPLGKAAIEKAKKRAHSAVDSLADLGAFGGEPSEAEVAAQRAADAQAFDNAEKLTAGIKPLETAEA